ncbi:MAG: hypothetical protein II980_02875 [Clostridia bacterium]|nr:hypothetical protein [Clostridia bacterium]
MQKTKNNDQNSEKIPPLNSSQGEESSTKTAEDADNTSSEANFESNLSASEDFSTKSGENLQNTEPCGQSSTFSELISRDFEEFSRRFPNISRDSLNNNKNLEIFASGKENQPLLRIFTDFSALIASLEAEALAKARHELSLENASVGALSGAFNPSEPYFTKEQVQRMTKSEISRNFEAIRKSQARW